VSDGVAPDVRDGLTPVGRRALLALHEAQAQTPLHVKSARTVDAVLARGRVDGGRRAIYSELVRMASDWEVRHPLVDGQGFLGSIDGDGAASADYTQMRLALLGVEVLREAGEDDVPATAEQDLAGEPRVLPARFPNLLVNGSFSVATGAASSIPPHNLREVTDAAIAFIEDPRIDMEGLLHHVRGPDFPTGAVVHGDGLHDAYATGRGSIVVRARAEVEPGRRTYERVPGLDRGAGPAQLALRDGPDWARAIVVSELPFMVAKGGRRGVLADIRRAMRSKKIRAIDAIDDQSSHSSGLRIVIELKRDARPDVVLEELYEHTCLQRRFELDLVAAVAGQARRLSLRDVIEHWVEHRRAVVARRSGLRSERRILEIVRNDLLDIADGHGDERRTTVRGAAAAPAQEPRC
jgi:DNA gyrase subunit A